MKTLLNWLLLAALVMGALGASPLAQDVSVIAQAEEPPTGESPEPLELPYVPAAPDGSALQMPADTGEVGREPEQPPFSIQLEMLCDARGQTARLRWNVTAELAATLNEKSEVTIKLPEGLLPAEGMEFAPDGLLHLAASPQGEVAFAIRQDAAESGWLEANLTSGDGLITPALAKFTPGAYARLTAEGGQVEAKALGVSVNFPEKVLPAETAICIGAVTEVELPNSLSGFPFQLNAYDAATGEEISKFDQEVAIRVGYESERYGGLESQLKLFYFNRELQDWAMLPTEVDTEANTLTGYSTHFTPFDIKPQSWESARLPNLDGFAVSEFSGAATYTYPIELPAGAGGWQPSLALTYNSQVVDNANTMTQSSWAGMGWSLDTGYIQRNMGDNVGVFGAGTDDTDTGNDGDDTFSLVLNGQSWRLLRLPDQDSNPNTIDYRTENESFQRIRRNHLHVGTGYYVDASTWEVWDTTGNKYTFSPLAHYPVNCSSIMVNWQWPLTSATNEFSQTISYTYYTETRLRRNAPDCIDAAYTEVAVYPATISYSGYQVVFDRTSRLDYKSTWFDEYQTIFFQRSRLAAIRILSQNVSNWELVRKYTLGYQDGAVFPNLLWNTSDPNSKTPSLVSITEYGSDGTTTLPITSFTYDGMHLTGGSNGYGGSVVFDYEGSSDRPWYEFTTTQNSIQGFETTQSQPLPFGSGLYGDFSLFDPGQMYKIELKVWPVTAACTAGYYYTISGTTTWNYATFIGEEIPSGANYKYMRWTSFVDLLGTSARFFFNCSGTGQVLPYYAKAWPLVNRYRVTAKTVSENKTNTSSTTAYTYTGASTNTPALSPNAGNVPYVKLRTEYRGNNSVTQIAPQGLASTTWYGQKDGYAGLALAQMTAEQAVYDDFDTLDTSLWSYSHYATRQTLAKEEGEPLLKMENPNADWSTVMVRNQPTLQDGESAVIQFKVSGANANALLALTTAAPNPYETWGVSIHNNASGNPVAEFQASGQSNQTLISAGTFHLDTWYVLMLTAGAEQFSARLWQRDDPAVFGQFSAPFSANKNWQFLQYINTGTLYLDDYREGPVHGLQLNTYAAGPGYTPPAIVPPFSLTGSTWYTGLAVRWLPLLQTVSFSLGESGRFTGTRQETQYDTAWQGNAQYGNQTNLIESYWTGSAWYPYRMTQTGYYPNVSLVYPEKNLSGLPGFSNQYQCEGDAACAVSNARLLGSTLYLYDTNGTYNQPPTAGVLKGKRSLLSWGNPAQFSDPRYLDEDTTYDACGNPATKIVYNSTGSETTRATANPHKTETIYDSQHCAFPLEMRQYYNTTQYYATTYGYDNADIDNNIRLGLLTRITDPNGAITKGGYDVFGRITWINRPGDDQFTNPTMRFSYNIDSTNHLFWTQVEQLISGTTYYKARKFYNGLGQLIQTQEDATVGGTLQTVVTNTAYNNMGLVDKQYMPFTVSLATGYEPSAGQFYTQTAYDALGRVYTVTQPDTTVTATNYNIYLLNGLASPVTYTRDALNHTSETWADAFGRLLKSQGAAGPAVTYTYDAADRLTGALYGSALTQITYDIAGRKLSLSDPDMGNWTYQYDALSNLTQQTDARGCVTSLGYDGLNRVTGKSYSNAGGGSCATIAAGTPAVTYTYDVGSNGIGQRTSMSDGSGSTNWTYDLRGQVTGESRTISGVNYQTGWTYNSAGRVASQTYPGGEVVTSSYLPQLKLAGLMGLDNYLVSALYDAAGRLTDRSLGNSLTQSYRYYGWTETDQYNLSGGGLKSIQTGTLQNLQYTHDEVGNILTVNDSLNSQVQSFGYDDINRLTSAAAVGGQNGLYNETYAYNTATGNLASKAGVGYTYGDTTHDHAVTLVDDDSNVSSKTITIRAKKFNANGVTTHPLMQLYIDGQQVASWLVTGRSSYANYTTTQTISNNEEIAVLCSNCSQYIWLDIDYVTVGSQTVQAEGPATLLDLGVDEEAFDWLNVSKPAFAVLVEPGAMRFVVGNNAFAGKYDANGNLVYRLVNGLATIMTYDAGNRLVSLSGGATASFVYNGDDERVQSIVNGLTTTYVNSSYEVSGGVSTSYYFAEGQRIAMRKSGVVSYLLPDHLGSTMLTTGSSGVKTAEQWYKAWGEVRYSSGSLQTKYTYTGQYSNTSDFGLMYYNARWYDPLLSRFSSADPIVPQPGSPQAWDRYSYVQNSPLNYTDPSGHRACIDDDEYGQCVTEDGWKPGTESGWMKIHNTIIPNPENRPIDSSRDNYTIARLWLVDNFGWEYVNPEDGKIDDEALITFIIFGEFGGYKYLEPTIYLEALEAMSNQYFATYSENGNFSNIQCGGSCSLGEQIAWVSDMETWYKGGIFSISSEDWDIFYPDAEKVVAHFSNGVDSKWFWGNTNTPDNYLDAISTTLSMYPGMKYFVVYRTQNTGD